MSRRQRPRSLFPVTELDREHLPEQVLVTFFRQLQPGITPVNTRA